MTPSRRPTRDRYPIGIPLLYLVLLSTKRSILKIPKEVRDDAQQKQVSHLTFIAGSYKPKYWYVFTISHRSHTPTSHALA